MKKSEYATPGDFANDVRLIWKNCMTYNQVAHIICGEYPT